jgi:exosortase
MNDSSTVIRDVDAGSARISPSVDVGVILDFLRKNILPISALVIGLGLACYGLWPILPQLYSSPDGYYSHGVLVPFISAYILYCRWPKENVPQVASSWVPLVLLLPVFFFLRAANHAQIGSVLSAGLVSLILLGVWFVAGRKWMAVTAPGVLYLFFGLPVWSSFLDSYTNPLQLMSTTVAYRILQLVALSPMRVDPTTIYLPSFTLNVAVPCSGIKLLLALTAFAVLFVLIAKLGWKQNLAILVSIIPFCLFFNGLRIALIGIVGNAYGEAAGHAFHDWSGYLTLVLCFLALFKFTRMLGWSG